MTSRTRARILGLAVVGMGIVNVLSAITPSLISRVNDLRGVIGPDTRSLASGAVAITGLVLVLLGRGIAQRHRAAYLMALGLLLVSVLANVIKGLDIEEASGSLLIALILFASRRTFIVPHERARWRTFARAVVVLAVIDFAYGIGGLLLRRAVVTPRPTFLTAARETALRLIGGTGPLRVGAHLGKWFPHSITVLGGLTVLALVWFMLAPVAERELADRHERDRIRELIERDDGDSLDFFALRKDKRYVFSADERAAVAYRYVNGVGLASGDPVGEPSSFADAAAAFIHLCERRGWKPAVLGAREDRTELWRALGLKAFYLGDEALIDVPSFSLEGRRMRNVRQSAAHTRAAGIVTSVQMEADLDPTLRRALEGVAERHLDGAPERGFSMALGGIVDAPEPSCVVVVARDLSGAPVAFQRYVPCRAGGALSLDVMRRDPHATGGVNERMIIDLIEWARDNDVDQISLNFAAFRGLIDPAEQLSLFRSAQAWVVRRLSPHFQIESLRKFNAKFHPRWVQRYVMYRSAADITAVGLASLTAESFLPSAARRGA